MARLDLFGDNGDGEESKIEINREFAKRYEHNKKREDLQRYDELKRKGKINGSESDSGGSSSEEYESELIKPSKKTDFEFFDALIKVKNQDPILRNKDSKLFDSDSDNGSDIGDESEKEKKKKPMYLKDVVSKQLIEDGPEFDDEEMEIKSRVKSYSEEQEEFRREFLEAVEEEENDQEGDFLKVKNGGSKDEEDEEEDEIGGKLDDYFGEDEKLDKDMMFLKDYFRNRRWIDDGKSRNVEGDDEVQFSEDEEEIEKQESYEKGYNFRFEENTGDRVTGHSRKVEGSVRKKDNARKSQRERKEERMAQAEFERKEELKRLKNLKRKEINSKLEKIKEAAGVGKNGSVVLDEIDLEGEFDPEEYDRKMNEAFGDRYYKTEDVDSGFGSDDVEDEDGLEKPDFDKEDEFLGLSKGWDEANGPGDGFVSARERVLKKKADNGDENDGGEDEDENDGGEDNEVTVGKRKRKRKPSEVEKAIRDELMEEYYKLDYEDTIGDLKTRFKYKPVKAKRYGLSPGEVLAMDDKDLNEYVSLKKLAPYEEKEWKVPRIKTIQLKQRTKDSITGETSENKGKNKRQHELHDDGKATSEGVSEVENGGLSRGSKRRRRQAELRLSHSRLMAYDKNPSKSKSKKQ